MRRIAGVAPALLAIIVLSGPLAAAAVESGGPGDGRRLAQAQPPSLPPAPPPIGPLRRNPDGRIEVIAPPTDGERARASPCSPKAICVDGRSQLRTLSDALRLAQDGALIEIVGGVYRESVTIEQSGVTIRGVAGRPHFNCHGLKIAEDQACLLLGGRDIVLDNLEISGAAIAPELGANGACVRNRPGRSFTVRGLICHDSQNGMLTAGGSVLIENSEFYDNGLAGHAHNIYLAGDCEEVVVRNSSFRDARGGHEFKSRCRRTIISDSSFRSTRGSRNIDIPDGGETFIYNSLLSKSPWSDNADFIGFAAESCRYPAAMHLRRVRFINHHSRGAITNYDKCRGQPILIEEATFEGTRPLLNGGVLLRDGPTSPTAPSRAIERPPGRGPAQPPPESKRPGPSGAPQSKSIGPQSTPELPRRTN